jgi:hypothetical protein
MSKYIPALLMILGGFLLLSDNINLPNVWDYIPTPNVAPIKQPGLRVMMLYDAAMLKPEDQGGYTLKQRSVLDSAIIREYLNQQCAKDQATGTPEYRIFNINSPVTDDLDWVKEQMAIERKVLPWLLVSNGKTGYEGVITNIEDTMAIIKKYEVK